MALNNPNAPGGVSRPRLRVLLNGTELTTPLSASVDSNNAFHADRFSVQIVPPLKGFGSLDFWSSLDVSAGINLLDVQIGQLATGSPEDGAIDWTSMVQGEADNLSYSTQTNTLTLTGRDLTARMIDTKTEFAYANQTSSEVVIAIAQKHGLTPVVTATQTPVGRYWQADHTALLMNKGHSTTTEWDLIVSLARLEMFDAYVVGTELHFAPYTAPDANPYVILWQIDQYGRQLGNVPMLSFERALTIAKGIQVIVKSWNGKQKRAFSRTAGISQKTSTPGGTGGPQGAQQFVYVIADLTEDQAQQKANAIYADLIKHEYVVRASGMIGDSILNPRCVVQVNGTGTAFDQVYYPVSVSRRIGVQGGYTMSAECRTTNPQTAAQAQGGA